MQLISTPGVYKIESEFYHADPCITPSLSRGTILDLLNKSCSHTWYNHPRLNPAYKKAEDLEGKFSSGSAAHDLLLEGGKKIFVVAGFDDWKKKEAQEARKAAREIGQIPLLQKQYDLAYAMTEAAKVQIKHSPEVGADDLAIEGLAEMTYVFNDSGIWERCLVDWISFNQTLILDYKTTKTSANPSKFSRMISNMDYQIQYAWYRHVVRGAAKLNDYPTFVWIVQEEEPPYLCSFFGLDPLHEEMAKEQIDRAVRVWRKCMKSGKWPGYTNRVCYAEAPPWTLAEWEQKKYQLDDDAREEE
jgi:hypothetical protein